MVREHQLDLENSLREETFSDRSLGEKCAVFGIYDPSADITGTVPARTTFFGLWALQHRGQESSGIVSTDGNHLYQHCDNGLVAHVYDEQNLDLLPGNIAIGHNRYGTSGGEGDHTFQPFLDSKERFSFAHNGNIPDSTLMETFLSENSYPESLIKKYSDSKLMQLCMATYMDQGMKLEDAIISSYPLFTGAFSSVALSQKSLFAFRDSCGIRPLSIGKLNDSYIVASETCAFETIGAEFIRDVLPGELVVINEDGITSIQIEEPDQKMDIFEFVYFARPDSTILGQRVAKTRERFGKIMADEFKIEADVVMPVPDSSIPAAIGYSNRSGIEYTMGIVKNRYIHRTFIEPTEELRKKKVKMKLNLIEENIRDKRVILVDDSIVRGTTMKQVVEMLRKAGAKEVHIAISSPPVMYPDYYGINTPDPAELIVSQMSVEEMCDYLNADSLHFLSIDGMVKATNLPASTFSMSCFDGKYPIPIGNKEKVVGRLRAKKSIELEQNLIDDGKPKLSPQKQMTF